MIQEVEDLFGLLIAVHKSIDKMVNELTDEEWMKQPLSNFNNIVSVLDHITRVERKFISAIGGQNEEINTAEPFQVEDWNLDSIRKQWAESLPYAASVLEAVTQEQLSEPGIKVGVGELNKRQLLSNAIAHAAHHRGQIPLIKKLMA